ncbi:MAG: PEP-CTERM sorting domain-containing protein [Proteobacteria bacterium]|nr:PEP-CTERM sorting domain-containing protein [Pseudomonadota bacterium]
MRLSLTDNGNYAGSLVLEYHYQNQTDAPTGQWITLSATLNSGIFWATNAQLGPTQAAADGGEKTLSQWLAGNPGEDIEVTGVSIGIGSGQAGGFSGAVDHVTYDFAGGPSANFDFQTVPEPSAWALMILGFGGVGAAMRRRQRVAATA